MKNVAVLLFGLSAGCLGGVPMHDDGTPTVVATSSSVSVDGAQSPSVDAGPAATNDLAESTTLPEEIRFNPGHYMWIDTGSGGGARPAGWVAQIAGIAKEESLKGVELIVKWSDLEGAKQGDYTAGFALVDALLAEAQKDGKQLMLDVSFQTYGGTVTAGTVPAVAPAYLSTILNGQPGYYVRPDGASWSGNLNAVIAMWEPTGKVMDAYIAMGKAYAARYDGKPNIEMWGTGETAIGSPEVNDAEWLTQLERWMVAMRTAWPHTAVRVPTNYMGSAAQMSEVYAKALEYKITCGGPDDYSRAEENPLFNGASGTDYRGKIPWVAESQYPASSSGGLTNVKPEGIYDWNESGDATQGGSMAPNYYIWSRNGVTSGTNGPLFTWNADTLPFIRSIDGKAHTTRPTGY
jgi:hypothetical protein